MSSTTTCWCGTDFTLIDDEKKCVSCESVKRSIIKDWISGDCDDEEVKQDMAMGNVEPTQLMEIDENDGGIPKFRRQEFVNSFYTDEEQEEYEYTVVNPGEKTEYDGFTWKMK